MGIVDSPRLPARPGKKKLPTSTTTQNQIQTTTKLQNSSLEFQQIPLTAKSNKKPSSSKSRNNSPRRSSSSSNNKKLSKSSAPAPHPSLSPPSPASLQQQ